MNWRLGIFWKEAVVFLFVQVIGLAVAWRLLPQIQQLTAVSIPVWVFVVYLAVGIALIIFAIRLFKSPIFFQIFFALLIFIGSEVVFDSLGFGQNAALLAVTLVVLRLIHPTIWTQNTAIVLALAGVGAAFGVGISIGAAIILLMALSVYDVIAVIRTNYLVKVFSTLVDRGVFLSIIIPEKTKEWGTHLGQLGVGPGSGVVILGTGDLVLPLIFASAAMVQDPWLAVGSIVGALAGLFGVHAWLLSLKKPRALPALPPLALGIFIGYGITWVILQTAGML